MLRKRTRKSSERGFSLLEVVLVLGLMTAVYTIFIQSNHQDAKSAQAKLLGSKLHAYQTASRRYASIHSGDTDFTDTRRTEVGSHWLKLNGDCNVPANLDAASGDVGLIDCNFPDNLIAGIASTAFSSVISKDDEDVDPLIIKTVIDMKSQGPDGEVTTILDDGSLSLSAVIATGGNFASALSIAGESVSSVEPYMSSSSTRVTYCPIGFDDNMLNDDCNVDGILEKGVIVMVTEAYANTDIWVRTDGSNTMNNNLTFNSETPSEYREIVNVNRLYNITGEFLKLGNSGVFDDDNPDWAPVLGNGVVIDTDAKLVGNLLVDGDIETKGEVYAEGDIISEGFMYSNEGISTLGDMDVAGSAIVLGTGLFQNGLSVIGETITDTAYVNSFLEAQEVYSRGNVYANTAISAPYVRASVGLFSEGDLMVARDSFIGGSQYIEKDVFVKGNVYTEGDLVANQGAAYLSTAFADVIFDNNGNYLLDPSDISRVNVMRANRYAAGTPGGTLNMNANSILFAAEDEACTSSSASCATSLEGFWDMESLYVKRESTDQWIRLVDWLDDINTLTEDIDNNLDDAIDDYNEVEVGYLECFPVHGGVIFKGTFRANWNCP